jgi:hypothetical protein
MMYMGNIADMHQKSHHEYLPLVLFPYGNFASPFAHATPELLAQFAPGRPRFVPTDIDQRLEMA